MAHKHQWMEKSHLVLAHPAHKIKFFIWLLTENKLNTWDNLLRKGWSGPNFFHLCHLDSETAEHIFINCQFTKQVWLKIALALNLHTTWDGTNIADCFVSWTQKERIAHPPPTINLLDCLAGKKFHYF
jgi:hypothetical protein